MRVPGRVLSMSRELGPVALVAIGVVLASTMVTSVFDRMYPVDAEEMNLQEVMAVAGPEAGKQQLTIQDWGVQLVVPLAVEMPLLSYAQQSPATVGLTSEALKKLNAKCTAGGNSLGSIVRLPAGAFAAGYDRAKPNEQFIKTLDGYDYVYQWYEDVACIDSQTLAETVMQERAIMYEALSSLSLVRE